MNDEATAAAVAALPAVVSQEGEVVPAKRPGRPKGATNKNRVATIERIMRESDPIGFLMKIQRGGKIKAAPEAGAQVIDLMEALKRSVAEVQGRKTSGAAPKKKAAAKNGASKRSPARKSA